MKPRDAFEICHEIYAAARELVDSHLTTTQMQSSGKFLWRPDLHPRLVEYVADFALAGQRALADSPDAGIIPGGEPGRAPGGNAGRGARKPRRRARKPLRASRLILFRVYFLGGAEYQAARELLGISERTWADWADEVRDRVGRELLRKGMFPPAKYFREMSRTEGGGKDARRN